MFVSRYNGYNYQTSIYNYVQFVNISSGIFVQRTVVFTKITNVIFCAGNDESHLNA